MNWLKKIVSPAPSTTTSSWDKDALIIDVRSAGEFAAGHVDGALNLPLDRFAQNHAQVAPDKAKQIILYCLSGARSGQAMQFLMQQGYLNVVNGGSASAVALRTTRPIRRH